MALDTPPRSPGSPPATNPVTSPWLKSLFEYVGAGRHVLLHGNVDDLVLVRDGEHEPQWAVIELLKALGYQAVYHYDIVDGLLTLVDDSAERGADLAEGPPAEAPRGVTAAREQIQATANRPRQTAAVDPDWAVQRVQQILIQTDRPSAVLVDSGELLIRDPRNVDIEERQLLMRLKKAMRDAASIGALSNVLVMTVPRLASVPEWFLNATPLVPLEIPRPGMPERRRFLDNHLPDFYAADPWLGAHRDRTVDQVAAQTDGLSFRDLAAMSRHSQLTHVSLEAPARMVTQFRHGVGIDLWSQLREERVRDTAAVLTQAVIGQDAAVTAVAEAVMGAFLGIGFDPVASGTTHRPKAAFWLVGPTGVGKTELAKTLALHLFEDEGALLRFDMSEFKQEHSDQRLIGSPPGYVGYGEGGELTGAVIRQPFRVVLFDEVEKAHEKILDKFLQILDDGRLTDGQGQVADFSQTVIIFTSNQGTDALYRQGNRPEDLDYAELEAHYKKAIQSYFTLELKRPELLGRLGADNILVFDVLRPESVAEIARKFLDRLRASSADRDLVLEFDTERAVEVIRAAVSHGDALATGGRGIRDAVKAAVLTPVIRWMLQNPRPAAGVRIDWDAHPPHTPKIAAID